MGSCIRLEKGRGHSGKLMTQTGGLACSGVYLPNPNNPRLIVALNRGLLSTPSEGGLDCPCCDDRFDTEKQRLAHRSKIHKDIDLAKFRNLCFPTFVCPFGCRNFITKDKDSLQKHLHLKHTTQRNQNRSGLLKSERKSPRKPSSLRFRS